MPLLNNDRSKQLRDAIIEYLASYRLSQKQAIKLNRKVNVLNDRPNVYKFLYDTYNTTDLSMVDLSGIDFSGANLQYLNLSGANIKNCNFTNAALFRTNLKESIANNKTCFKKANIIMSDLSEIKLDGANFKKATIHGSTFQNSSLISTNFKKIDSLEVDFQNANLEKSNFTEALLFRANFNNSNLRKTILSKCDLKNSSFLNSKLYKSDFTLSDLKSAQFDRANLDRTIFKKCNLSTASFRYTNFNFVDFEEAVLTDADFSHSLSNTKEYDSRKDNSDTFWHFFSASMGSYSFFSDPSYPRVRETESRKSDYTFQISTTSLRVAKSIQGLKLHHSHGFEIDKDWQEKHGAIYKVELKKNELSPSNSITKEKFELFNQFHRRNSFSLTKVNMTIDGSEYAYNRNEVPPFIPYF